VQGWITQEESRGVQLTNQEYEDRITKFEKDRTAEGIAAFQPPPAGFKFKFVKKAAAAVVASLAEAGHESNHWDVHEERLLVSESGDLAATVDGSKSAGDKCHIHPQHSHTNAECFAQHPELRPTRGAQGGRGSGGGGGRGGNSNSSRTKDKRVCYKCGKVGHVQRDCNQDSTGHGGQGKQKDTKVWKGGRRLDAKESGWCRSAPRKKKPALEISDQYIFIAFLNAA
jgi:hypothetical protein